MGGSISRFIYQLVGKKHHRFVMIGLDAAGKTTILYKMKLGDVTNTVPTIGFTVENVAYKNFTLTTWDVGGRCPVRPLWRHYFRDTTGIVFVVDSNDRERLGDAEDELTRILKSEELNKVPLLVFANKQDLPNAASVAAVVEQLRLNDIRSRPWFIQSSCATAGDGLYEGMDWLTNESSHFLDNRVDAALNSDTESKRSNEKKKPAATPIKAQPDRGKAEATATQTAPKVSHMA